MSAFLGRKFDEGDARLDQMATREAQESAETRAMIRFSYAQLERRIQEIEGNYASLNQRVGRLESSRA